MHKESSISGDKKDSKYVRNRRDKKMNPTTSRRLLVMFIGTFLIILVTFGSVFIMNKLVREDRDNTPEQEKAAQTAIENAKKLDPNGEKIVLSEELLSTDYKIYYEHRQSTVSLVRKLPFFMFGFGILIGGFTVFLAIIKRRNRGQRVTPFVFVPAIMILVFCVGTSVFISYAAKRAANKLPKPENATYNVYSMNVLGKEAKTTKKKTGKKVKTSTTTSYYIYYEGQNGDTRSIKVNSTMYDQVGENGIYFMAGAEENGNEEYFKIYDPDLYMRPVS